jgi:hypothetical protein
MTPNLDDKYNKNRVMSRETLISQDRARNLSFERELLLKTMMDESALKKSNGDGIGKINLSKFNFITLIIFSDNEKQH